MHQDTISDLRAKLIAAEALIESASRESEAETALNERANLQKHINNDEVLLWKNRYMMSCVKIMELVKQRRLLLNKKN